MNRRSFIASLIATAALDPEKLLWIPTQKKIFIPPPGNQFLTINEITREALRILHNNMMSFAKFADLQATRSGSLLVGDTITIHYPKRTL